MSTDAEAVYAENLARIARYREDLRRVGERSVALESMRERLQKMQTTVTSPGREVTVTLGSSGLLENVQYTARGMQLTGTALAALTLRTIRQAMVQLQASVDEAVAEDPMNEFGAVMARSYHETFASSIEELNGGGITYR
jgi:hypothetical protein